MKHVPSNFAPGVPKLAENATDEAFEAWMEALPPCPGIRSIDDDDDDDIAQARADIKAGRGVPHEQVAAWLRTWGTPDEKPMPPEWLE